MKPRSSLGNFTEAAQMFQSAVAADEKNVLARARLGRMLALAGLPDRALEVIAPALVTTPDDAGLLTVRAAARMLKGDLAAARTDAERAVQARSRERGGGGRAGRVAAPGGRGT